jgi:hypothetical protein
LTSTELVQGAGDRGSGDSWEFAGAEEVFKALWLVVANDHSSEMRRDSEVVGECPQGSLHRRRQDNVSEELQDKAQARVAQVEWKVQ